MGVAFDMDADFMDPVLTLDQDGATQYVGIEAWKNGVATGSRPGIRYDRTNKKWQTLVEDGSWTDIGGGGAPPEAQYTNEQANGTDGGTATSGSWQTYPLNTEDYDASVNASIASNVITLPAGTYRFHAAATFYQCGWAQLRVRQTDGTATTHGSSGLVFARNTSAGDQIQAVFGGRFTLASTQTIELQYQVTVTRATYGLGQAPASTDGWGETFQFGYLRLTKE